MEKLTVLKTNNEPTVFNRTGFLGGEVGAYAGIAAGAALSMAGVATLPFLAMAGIGAAAGGLIGGMVGKSNMAEEQALGGKVVKKPGLMGFLNGDLVRGVLLAPLLVMGAMQIPGVGDAIS